MHPNTAFHTKTEEQNLAWASERAFGLLAVNGRDGPLMSHVPFLVEDAFVWLHLVRSNPIISQLERPLTARIAVSGPDGYVSPDWYDLADQVPTWNYIAVHIIGTLELRPVDELKVLLDRQTEFFERRLVPKPPWSSEKMSSGVMDRMMRAILPCRLKISEVKGTWKLNQNKPDAARLAAASCIAQDGIGQEVETLANLMREPEPTPKDRSQK